MSPRLPVKGTTTVDVHPRPNRPGDSGTPRSDSLGRQVFDPSNRVDQPDPRTRLSGDSDLDTMLPAPTVTVHPAPSPVEITADVTASLESYRIRSVAALPDADSDGFRTYNNRRYVDLVDGGTVLIGTDPDTGLYRARLSSELRPSGPALARDRESGLWHPLDDVEASTAPLTEKSLQALRTELDFSAAEPDSDGVFHHDGKLYVVIHNHAYQAMHDLDASTPTRKVWRLVNPGDPVASDSANIYRSSRSGETRAITRNEENAWVSFASGLRGGMRRREARQANRTAVTQRYEPIRIAHAEIRLSAAQFDILWNRARSLPEGPARTEVLVEAEEHLHRHLPKLTEFVQSLVDNRDWLPMIKANGLFKRELHAFRIERVEYLNMLMVVMDLRVRPTVTDLSEASCRITLQHLDRKLKLLEEREVVLAQIKKASPGAAPEIEELRRKVPDIERVNFNKLTLYVHLFAGTPDYSPNRTMPSLAAIELITGDLHNAPQREHSMALMLALDQIKADKARFETLHAANPPNADDLKEIIALIDPIENRIEQKLNETLDTSELPNLDENIDFDFIPPQPVSEPQAPAPRTRKVFRTRQHGLYRVLAGETETAADGTVTVNVPDVLRPDSPPRRYRKVDDEWLPVLPPITRAQRPELIAEAQRLLAGVDAHLTTAQTQEAQKILPTQIVEDLGKQTDLLNRQARQLENHETDVEDRMLISLAGQLRRAADSLTTHGQQILVRMYKDKDVLDIMRLNFLLDRKELAVSKTVERKQMGKGKSKS
ncbi:MAG TPA: hypothetical protein VNV36_17820, partial [Pseudomonas sp.]|uniref:hypothetical protein n=1 Tax=Pseudomonas sp. TaxID=306 RepID=UPI002C159A08